MSRSLLLPRVAIAGLGGESGKTLVSMAILTSLRERGVAVRAFKKGPDYIDAAWLTWASQHPARNLDSYLMGFEGAVRSFTRHAVADGLNLIEGNRGLYDGSDSRGTHSTAELAKALDSPVILVANAAKVTRTLAACVLGCQKLDPAVRFAGVILNRISSPRHERVIRESIENACGIPVLGVVPRASGDLVPERHLGLITPAEHRPGGEFGRRVLDLAARIDLDRILAVAGAASPLETAADANDTPGAGGAPVRIGYIRDSAFTFYYPENLEALERAGATLVPVSALADSRLPEIDALYIGGGFPETHAASLAANSTFMAGLRTAAHAGMPIYAECGGLMLLSRAIQWKGSRFPMAGVLPFDVEVCSTPQGHGYSDLVVDRPNPFFPVSTRLKGHEFHYSRIVAGPELPPAVCAVRRGSGCYCGRDGIVIHNVWVSYTHLHGGATPEWAIGLLSAANSFLHECIAV